MSATKIVMRKSRAGLLPVDDAGAEVMRRIANGRDVIITVKTARNPDQHRLFFAVLRLLVDNGSTFPTVEAALKAVKVGLGLVEPVINAATGEIAYALESVDFESMDGTRFSALFDAAIHLIADRWLGTSDAELRNRVFEMIDGAAASSLGRRVAA